MDRKFGQTAELPPRYERLARLQDAILISGESGSGKTDLARAFHSRSGRREDRIVVQGCAEIPEGLFASVLFGHRKGAFSSADGDVSGLLQHCDGGTLVLDDVDALEPPQQMILLRFLDTGLAAPVSAPERERRLDVRIIATTNHDLSQQARCTRFRDDFFYRLAQFHVRVPPLRERSGGFRDVLAQIEAELRAEFGPDYRGVDAGVAGLLGLDPWPGNFRELRAYLRGLFILGDPDRRGPITLKELHSVAREEIGLREPLDRLKARAREEPDLVRRVLQLAGGNKTLAAGLLGYSRETIHEKIRQHRWKI